MYHHDSYRSFESAVKIKKEKDEKKKKHLHL